jgi:hypothetical protein
MAERMRISAPQDRAGERSFPLVAVFHLATFWAAMAACVDGAALFKTLNQPWQWDGPAQVAAAVLLAIVLFGAAVGLGQLRMWRSAAAGALFGALYGPTMLAVYVAPASIGRGLAAAGLLIVTTLAFRLHAA